MALLLAILLGLPASSIAIRAIILYRTTEIGSFSSVFGLRSVCYDEIEKNRFREIHVF